jgi:hypothetical protein
MNALLQPSPNFSYSSRTCFNEAIEQRQPTSPSLPSLSRSSFLVVPPRSTAITAHSPPAPRSYHLPDLSGLLRPSSPDLPSLSPPSGNDAKEQEGSRCSCKEQRSTTPIVRIRTLLLPLSTDAISSAHPPSPPTVPKTQDEGALSFPSARLGRAKEAAITQWRLGKSRRRC